MPDLSPLAAWRPRRNAGALVTRVTESVWCIQRRAFLSCCYLVVRPEGITLVDSGIDPEARDVRAALACLGKTVRDVRTILLTHWHNDHSSGAAALARESGARVWYHADGAGRLTRSLRSRGLRGWVGSRIPNEGAWAPFKGLIELAPAHAVEAGEHALDGDLIEGAFRVLHTPGHEVGHLSYFYEPERVLFAGDALAVAGDQVSFMSRFLTHDIAAAKQSMMRCLELDSAAICPGHRYPLIAPTREYRQRVVERVLDLKWWPVVGC